MIICDYMKFLTIISKDLKKKIPLENLLHFSEVEMKCCCGVDNYVLRIRARILQVNNVRARYETREQHIIPWCVPEICSTTNIRLPTWFTPIFFFFL